MENSATFKYESKNFSWTWTLGTELKNLRSFATEKPILLRTGRITVISEHIQRILNNMEFFLELSPEGKGHLLYARIQLAKSGRHDPYTDSYLKVTDVMASASEQVWERGYHRRSFPINRTVSQEISEEDKVELSRNFPAEDLDSPNVKWIIWRQTLPDPGAAEPSTTNTTTSRSSRGWDNIDLLTFEVTVKSLLWTKFKDPFDKKGEIPRAGFLDTRPLFLSTKSSDLTIVCGAKEFPAHRIVLMSNSPVFASMFEVPMKESLAGRLQIDDTEPEIFEDFLRYLYTGVVETMHEHAVELVQIAHKYEVDGLRFKCEKHLVKSVNSDNLVTLWRLGDLLKLTALQARTTLFFKQNKANLIKVPDDVKIYLDNCPTLLLSLFKD